MLLPLFARSILFSLIFVGVSLGANAQQSDYYERGQQAAAQGNVDKALEIWLQAKGTLSVPNTRIGTAFIELVAGQEREDYYEFATLMYQWGLSAKTVAPNKEALEQEIERVGILAELDEYKRMRDLWKNDDPTVYKALLNFWKQLDPTPTSANNERLIEHWQRIAYSKGNFMRNKSSIFDADERAEVYVRYGAPDYKYNGQLSFDDGVARSYITEIANTPIGCNVGNSTPGGGNPVDVMLRHTKNFHQFPEYEVWVYRKTGDRVTKNIFIFGGNAAAGGYGLVNSVEDFIPNQAFSIGNSAQPPSWVFDPPSACISNIRAGLILQIVYYNQLANLDSFFGSMMDGLDSEAIDSSPTPISTSLGIDFRGRATSELKRQKTIASREESTMEKQMMDIPIRVFQYRLLDEQNRPYFATIMESQPQQAFLLDYVSNYSEESRNLTQSQLNSQGQFQNYRYVHALQIYNSSGEEEAQVQANPVIVTNKGSYSSTFFTVPAVGQGARQVFSATLENTDTESKYAIEADTPFPANMRGLGKTRKAPPTPLSNDESQLQMGDLILGFNYNSDASPDNLFPFVIANDRKIRQNEDLVVHFEIYHMTTNTEGIYDATFSYKITPEEGILGWFKDQEDDLTLSLNLESDSPRYIENLQIRTRALKPGTYVMLVRVEDDKTGQMVEREFEFEVVEIN